jgi:hypothetical protein
VHDGAVVAGMKRGAKPAAITPAHAETDALWPSLTRIVRRECGSTLRATSSLVSDRHLGSDSSQAG